MNFDYFVYDNTKGLDNMVSPPKNLLFRGEKSFEYPKYSKYLVKVKKKGNLINSRL